MESRKTQLAPLLKALNILKEEHQTLEAKYNAEKQKYDSTVLKIDNEKMNLVADSGKLETEYLKDETKYHSLSIQAQITECLQNKAANETLYKGSSDKRLSSQYKSYNELYKAKLQELDRMLKELKTQQRVVKESGEQNSKQVVMFNSLKKLLEVKMKSIAGGRKAEGASKEGGAGIEEENRLVLS